MGGYTVHLAYLSCDTIQFENSHGTDAVNDIDQAPSWSKLKKWLNE